MEIAVLLIIAAASAVAVLQPLFQPPPAAEVDFEGAPATPEAVQVATAAVEPELARYRDALRAGTVCGRCGQANPAGSRFCYECGRRLGRSAEPGGQA